MGMMDAFRWEKKLMGMIWVDTFVHISAWFVIFWSSGIWSLRRRPKTGKMHEARCGISMALVSLAGGLSQSH